MIQLLVDVGGTVYIFAMPNADNLVDAPCLAFMLVQKKLMHFNRKIIKTNADEHEFSVLLGRVVPEKHPNQRGEIPGNQFIYRHSNNQINK